MSKRYHNKFERQRNDFYATPLRSILPVIPYLRAAGVRAFAEPCAGDGALVRHLETAGFQCSYAGDIATGQDALLVAKFEAPIVTNPPFARATLLPLLDHFISAAPSVWLLLPADFAHVAYSRPFLVYCSDIVSAGRAAWFGGSGTENVAWYRFDRRSQSGPVFHNGSPPEPRTIVCMGCGRAFRPRRSDAKT